MFTNNFDFIPNLLIIFHLANCTYLIGNSLVKWFLVRVPWVFVYNGHVIDLVWVVYFSFFFIISCVSIFFCCFAHIITHAFPFNYNLKSILSPAQLRFQSAVLLPFMAPVPFIRLLQHYSTPPRSISELLLLVVEGEVKYKQGRVKGG